MPSASWRRRACQTMARNIADISGTSNNSPQSCSPENASLKINAPVTVTTTDSVRYVAVGRHTRKPKSSVRLMKTKWNGTVSQLGHTAMATKFAIAKAAQAASGHLRCSKPIARMANGFDRRVCTELFAEPANADVDDVRPRIEVVTPDLRDQTFSADHLTLMLEQVMENAEFAIRQLRGDRTKARLAPRKVEHEHPRANDVVVF